MLSEGGARCQAMLLMSGVHRVFLGSSPGFQANRTILKLNEGDIGLK